MFCFLFFFFFCSLIKEYKNVVTFFFLICSNVVSCIKIDLFKHCTVSPGEDFLETDDEGFFWGAKGRRDGWMMGWTDGRSIYETRSADMVSICLFVCLFFPPGVSSQQVSV